MKSYFIKIIFTAALLGAGSAAEANIECTENIVAVILHVNGNIYFQSDQTCGNWCQVNMGTDAMNKNVYAMLLSAKMGGRPLLFNWPNLASCSSQNATYAAPAYVQLR